MVRLVAIGRLLGVALWFLGASSCASYTDETKEIRGLYNSGQYNLALKKIDDSSLKDSDRNQLLYLLERGMILDRLDRSEDARSLLFKADRLVDKLYTTSISRETLTYIYNDSAQNYPGEDYEQVAIHTVLALSFLQDKNINSATVEARKINTRLAEINSRYDQKKNRYGEDALARYLAGSIYESQGKWDDAIIDYRKALALYEGVYKKEFATGVPDHLVESLYRLLRLRGRTSLAVQLEKRYPGHTKRVKTKLPAIHQQGGLVVIHEVGSIAFKTAKDFFIPFGKQVIRLSFPTINPRYHGEGRSTGVKVVGQSDFYVGELVQNMDQIASKTLDDRRLRLVLKQGARLLAKGQLTEQAHRKLGPIGGIAANVYSAVTETADTRSWTTLPGAFYMTRVRLAPGTYKVVLKSGGTSSKVVTVKIPAGRVTLLRHRGR